MFFIALPRGDNNSQNVKEDITSPRSPAPHSPSVAPIIHLMNEWERKKLQPTDATEVKLFARLKRAATLSAKKMKRRNWMHFESPLIIINLCAARRTGNPKEKCSFVSFAHHVLRGLYTQHTRNQVVVVTAIIAQSSDASCRTTTQLFSTVHSSFWLLDRTIFIFISPIVLNCVNLRESDCSLNRFHRLNDSIANYNLPT